MINLTCGRNLGKLGIRNWEGGVNISVFLDHLEACDECREARMALLEELNKEIGGEQGFFRVLSSHR